MISGLLQDARYALRSLRRNPGFAVTAALTLSLGIGAAVALFTVVNTVLLRPLPFVNQDRLVLMWEKDDPANNPHIEVSLPNFSDWRTNANSFRDMAAIGSTTWGDVEVQRDPPVRLTVSAVSTSFFETLGAQAALGRTFLPGEGGPDAGRVMVLSHASWQQYFAADPDVVGTTVSVGAQGEPYTIVGVMPRAFQFPPGAELWTPVGRQLANVFRANALTTQQQRGLGVLYVIGRLAPGVTLEQAQAEMNVIVPRLWEAHFGRGDGRSVFMTPLADYMFGSARLALFSLLGGVMLVLLIASTNVTGLLIIRGHARRRDIAVQRALGISRARLLRYHLVETGLLAGVAGLGGVALARVAVPVLIALGPTDVPRLRDATVDGAALVLALVVTLICALAMGVVSMPRVGDASLVSWLKSGTPGATAGRSRARARDALIVAEVAMALVLVVGAGLLTSSYLNLTREDLGFRDDQVLTVGVSARDEAYPTVAQKRLVYREILSRVRGLPGVEAAGGVFLLPFEHGVVGADGGVVLEGEPLDRSAPTQRLPVAIQAVSPGYFQAMGINQVEGRTFTARDTADTPGVVVVGASLARRLWPTGDAIGQRLIAIGAEIESGDDQAWQTVVGVVDDVRYREIERSRLNLYVSMYQVPMDVQHLVVRTAGNPASMAPAVRDAVHQVDRNLVVGATTTLTSLVSGAMRPWKFNMTISTTFAMLALGLSAIGLFGTVAYSVGQRTREIGVRRALGAQAVDVVSLVWTHAMLLTLLGASIGTASALLLGESIRPLLFGVTPHDATTLASLGATLLLVCAAASLLAAWRATRIDPVTALRTE